MADETLRVKLSADGVVELIAALRAVEGQIVRTSTQGRASMDRLGKATSALTGVFGALGVAVSVGALVGFARSCMALGDQLDKLVQKMGGASDGAVTLAYAARQADVPLTGMDATLGTASRNLRDFEQGGGKAARALGQLGFHAGDFKGKGLGESIQLVAQRLAPLEAGFRKNALVADVFGRAAVALVPALNNLGRTGMDAFTKNLERLFSPAAIAAAAQMNDALVRMGFTMQGLGAKFIEGFAPFVVEGVSRAEASIDALAESSYRLGQSVGVFFKAIAAPFLTVGAVIAFIVAETQKILGVVTRAVGYLFGVVPSERIGFLRALREMGSVGVSAAKTVAAAWADVFRAPPPLQPPKRAAGAAPPPPSGDEAALAEARARRALDLQEEREKIGDEGDLWDSLYKRGLVSLRDYYKQRQELRLADTWAQIRSLQAEAKEPDKGGKPKTQAELLDTLRRIRALQHEYDRESKAGLQELADKHRELDRQVEDAEDKVFARGAAAHAARERDIEEEAAKYRLMLQQRGDEEMAVEAAVAAYREALRARARADETAGAARGGIEDLDRQKALYESAATAGVISRAEATARVLALERQELETLRDLAAAALTAANATGDPAKIRVAEDLAKAVQEITDNVTAQEDVWVRVRAVGVDALQAGLADFFSTGIQGSKNLLAAVQAMAGGVVSAIQRMLSEMMAAAIMRQFLGLFGVTLSGGGTPKAGGVKAEVPSDWGAAEGGVARRNMLPGGPVRGPGGPTGDAIPAWLSDTEHVQPARIVRIPGVLPFLERLRAADPAAIAAARAVSSGRIAFDLPGLRGPTGPHRFADGGLASGPGSTTTGGATLGGGITVGLEPGLVLKELETPEGQDALIRVVSRRRREFRGALG